MLKAVIFDMDGVLVNSEPMHYRAVKKVLAEYDCQITYEYYQSFIGSTLSKLCRSVSKEGGLPMDEKQIFRQVQEMKDKIIQEEGVEGVAGIPRLLKRLKESGLKLAVASSSPYDYILKITKLLGIYSYFDEIVSGETVTNPKPAPDVFLKTAAQLSVAGNECIIVEDSANGVKAANAAGIPVIGYENPDSGEQDLSRAAIIVQGFEEVDEAFITMTYNHSQGIPAVITKGRRTTVREMQPGDAAKLHRYTSELGPSHSYPSAGSVRQWEQMIESYQGTVYPILQYGYWSIVHNETGEIMGMAGLSPLNTADKLYLHLGYLIGPEYQQQGYGQEVCTAIIEYARDRLFVETLYILIAGQNPAAERLALSLDFKKKEQLQIEGTAVWVYEKLLWQQIGGTEANGGNESDQFCE